MSTAKNCFPPEDAFYQAEATLLFRAARANGGSLAGERFEATADREMSWSCLELLPLMGLRLGDPTVTFTGPLGRPRTISGGRWRREATGPAPARISYFDTRFTEQWPTVDEIAPFFIGSGSLWFDTGGNDSAALVARSVESGLSSHYRRDVSLRMDGFPNVGVMLHHVTREPGGRFGRFSLRTSRELASHIRTLHNSPVPFGLITPFEQAFLAVKEFIENDGRLPKSIAWVHENDLPEGTFPLP
jgi:hypothetical protein